MISSIHHTGLTVSSLDRALVFYRPVAIDTGANTGAWGLYVRDPDGIVLELFQPAPA